MDTNDKLDLMFYLAKGWDEFDTIDELVEWLLRKYNVTRIQE